jgi:hypothetical protein
MLPAAASSVRQALCSSSLAPWVLLQQQASQLAGQTAQHNDGAKRTASTTSAAGFPQYGELH